MEMFRKLYDYKGGRVRLVVDDGEYEGILKNLYADIGKISLSKVVPLPQRTPMFPLLHFFTREIRSYSVVSGPVEESKQKTEVKLRAADQEATSCAHQQYNITTFLHQDAFDSASEAEEETSEELIRELAIEDEYVLDLPKHLVDVLPADQHILDEIDEPFYKAVNHIKKQEVIGVGFEGDNIGRYDELYWLTISTSWCTFLFDIFTLKEEAFKEGLKEILESSEVLKIIHDSRQPSDALFHRYNTQLDNVFDSQVGDIFADMQNSKPGLVGKYVRPLRLCLMQHLSLKPEDFSREPVKFSSSQGCSSEWQYRPLPNALRDRAIKNAIYLKLLREQLMGKMFRSFYAAVDVYLNVVRGATAKELDLEPSVPHMLPQALLSAGLQTFHMKKFPAQAIRSKRDLGFIEPATNEDPIQAYLRHVERHEVMENMVKRINTENISDDECSDVEVQPKDTKTTVNVIRDEAFPKSIKIRGASSNNTPQTSIRKSQQSAERRDAVRETPLVNLSSNNVSVNGTPRVEASQDSNLNGSFQWPKVTGGKKHVPSHFVPAGISVNCYRTRT